MIPPISSLGSKFLVVPVQQTPEGNVGRDYIRVLASNNGTLVTRNGLIVSSLNKGEFFDFRTSESEVLGTSQPAIVTHYMSTDVQDIELSRTHESEMSIIPPVNQLISGYNFLLKNGPSKSEEASKTRFKYYYLNIAVPSNIIKTCELDSVLIEPDLFQSISNSGWSYARIPLMEGEHSVKCASDFFAQIVGFGEDTFFYPAGMGAKAINNPSDPFFPNARIVQVGEVLQGLATDSSDTNANGILDADELFWGNQIGPRSEDTNHNDVIDPGEDLNSNGVIDRDLGIARIELDPESSNLVLEVTPFEPGALAVPFTIRRIDPAKDGVGNVSIYDVSHNHTSKGVSILNGVLIRNVKVLESVSGNSIEIDTSSFVTVPSSVRQVADGYEIEWSYPEASSLSSLDLSYDVVFKSPVKDEQRIVSKRTLLQYEDGNGNPVIYEIGSQGVKVLDSSVELEAKLDKSEYVQGEAAYLSIKMVNLGQITTSTASACMRLLDSDGNLTEFQYQGSQVIQRTIGFSASTIPAGQTIISSPNPVPLGFNRLLLGSYSVEVMLLKSGTTCAPSNALRRLILPLNIVPTESTTVVDSALMLNRVTYQPIDNLAANTLVRNLLSQGIADGYKVRMQVMRQDNTLFGSSTRPVPQLVPLNQWTSDFSIALRNEKPGIYTAILQLLDKNDAVVDTHAAKFTVTSSADNGFGLQGALVLTPKQVQDGGVITFNAVIRNGGNALLADLPLKIILIDSETEAIVAEFAQTSTLAVGGEVTFAPSWTAHGALGKTYLAVLTATVGNGSSTNTLMLAQDNFQITDALLLSLAPTGGTIQTAAADAMFTNALEVTITDSNGIPAVGVSVTFAASSANGASIVFVDGATARTNTQGKATVRVKAGATAGSVNVNATADGVAGSAAFTLTITTVSSSCATPGALVFSPKENVARGALVYSNTVVVQGLKAGCDSVLARVDNGAFKLVRNGVVVASDTKPQEAAWVGAVLDPDFGTSAVTVLNGDQITLAQTASSSYNTASIVTLSLGDIPYVWHVSTEAEGSNAQEAKPIPIFGDDWRTALPALLLLSMLLVWIAQKVVGLRSRAVVKGE